MQKLKQYPNGLKLVVKSLPQTLSVAIGVFAGVGSADEDRLTSGISHYIEHMTFKGTAKRSAFEISDSVDRIGAQINAFTTKELTCYYTKSTAEHTEQSMDILSDIYFNSLYDDGEAQREKGVILEEISMVQDTPDDVCLDGLSSVFYKRHPLGKPILGTAKNVRDFTREDILAFRKRFYTAENTVITVAGKIKFEQAEQLVDRYFAEKFSGGEALPGRCGKRTARRNFGYAVKDIEQVHLGIAFDGVNVKSRNSSAAAVASMVLGGGMSSRLFQHVREKLGLAYSVYSYPSSYRRSGMLSVYAAVTPAKAMQAAEVIVREIKLLKADAITREEFLRAKEQIKSSLTFGQESNSSIMNAYGRYTALTGKLFNINKKLKEVSAVSYDDVCDYIRGEMFDFEGACAFFVGREKHKFDLSEVIN